LFQYIEYTYPIEHWFEKIMLWCDSAGRFYFGLKTADEDDYTFYSGTAAHGLDTNSLLVNRGTTEADAQTNYWKPTPDANNRVLAVLPGLVGAKYVRVYVDDSNDNPTQIYEFRPSTYFAADEILTGNLKITDDFARPPVLTVTKSSIDRIELGNYTGSTFGIIGRDDSSNTIFELSDNALTIGGLTIANTGLTVENGIDLTVSQGGDIIMSGGVSGNPSLIRFADEAVPGEIRFEQSGDDTAYWSIHKNAGIGGSDDLIFMPNNLTTPRIGIGTEGPSQMLHLVDSAGEVKIQMESSGSPMGNYIGITAHDNIVIAADEDNGSLNTQIRFRIDGAQIADLDANGKLQVHSLEITDDAPYIYFIDSTNTAAAYISTTDEGSLLIRADDNDTVAGSYIAMQIDGSEHLRLDASGNLTLSNGGMTLAGNLALAGNSITGTSVDINNSELQQLSNIGATTISSAQWGYLGAMDQDVSTGDSVTFAGITPGNITMAEDGTIGTAGLYLTFDDSGNNLNLTGGGMTLSGDLALAANSITGTSVDISNAELQQLSNIGATTISSAQWGYLGACSTGGGQLMANLTTGESTQLEAIGATTITSTQWGYLGAMDQGVGTGDSVQFAGITSTGDITISNATPSLTFTDTTNNGDGRISGTDEGGLRIMGDVNDEVAGSYITLELDQTEFFRLHDSGNIQLSNAATMDIYRDVDTGILRLIGTDTYGDGAAVQLCGHNNASFPGNLYLDFGSETQASTANLIVRAGNNAAFGPVMTVDISGNVGIGVSAFGTNATHVLAITADGTVPTTSPAGMIQIFADDSSDGAANATLAIRTEQGVEAGAPTPSHKLKIWVNGTEYWLSLDAV